MSFQGFTLDQPTGNDSEQKCIEIANSIAQQMNISKHIEAWVEGLLTYGNDFILKKNLTMLPPEKVTIRPREIESLTEALTSAEILYTDESTTEEKQYDYDEVYHIKYKQMPIFLTDLQGRLTFGLYSVSPLARLVYTTWWKRQSMIIDILWRWRMVPREHHTLSSKLFELSKYTGTVNERRIASQADAQRTIKDYIVSLKEQMPDQGVVTTDNVGIDVIESSTKFIDNNRLMLQLDSKVWQALNVPESTVSGSAKSSYASELVTSSFVGLKIDSLLNKVAPVLLDVIKKKVLAVDKSLPVSKLRVVHGFEIEAAKIEKFRTASIMASLGTFTLAEVRARAGYSPEVNGELFMIPTTRPPGVKGPGDILRDINAGEGIDVPETPWSTEAHNEHLDEFAREYPYKSDRIMSYHGRIGHPTIHQDEQGRTYVIVRKEGGGTKRLYDYEKYMQR
jgi:hypothetical protein